MSVVPKEKWSRSQIFKLIQEYKVNPILWDENDPMYYYKNFKPPIWEKIGQTIGKSAEACKHKIVILMSSLRREKARIKNSINNKGLKYTSRWFAWKQMQFLVDKSRKGKRRNTTKDDESENSSNSETSDESHEEDQEIKEPTATQQNKSPRIAKTTNDTRSSSKEDKSNHSDPSHAPTDREEELKAFTAYIHNKMKQYPDTIKNSVQQEICQVIFNADKKYYETMSCKKLDDVSEKPSYSNECQETATTIKIESDFESE